jgi:hypothetical protein
MSLHANAQRLAQKWQRSAIFPPHGRSRALRLILPIGELGKNPPLLGGDRGFDTG